MPLQVTFNNMPMLVLGASDCFASFCPGVIALCTNETQQQYEQILRLADSMVGESVSSGTAGFHTPVRGHARTQTNSYGAGSYTQRHHPHTYTHTHTHSFTCMGAHMYK